MMGMCSLLEQQWQEADERTGPCKPNDTHLYKTNTLYTCNDFEVLTQQQFTFTYVSAIYVSSSSHNYLGMCCIIKSSFQIVALNTKLRMQILPFQNYTTLCYNSFCIYLGKLKLNEICGLQLPRESRMLTRLLQLTGRWQIMYQHYAPSSLIMLNFLIRSATSQSSSYPIVFMRLGGPR